MPAGLKRHYGIGHLHCLHANPVIRGLLRHPKDWPWSSWSFYGKGELGLLRIDVEE